MLGPHPPTSLRTTAEDHPRVEAAGGGAGRLGPPRWVRPGHGSCGVPIFKKCPPKLILTIEKKSIFHRGEGVGTWPIFLS